MNHKRRKANNSQKKNMKTISFLNNKGGVGKTASVTTLAHILATQFDKKVLLVDMDPQANASNRFSKQNWFEIFADIMKIEKRELFELLGMEYDDETDEDSITQKLTIKDLLLDLKLNPLDVIVNTRFENLDMIPTSLTLATAESAILIDPVTPQQSRLKTQLDKIADKYDYCLIDCSPSVSILNINALNASDEVYVPTRTDGDSVVGMAISLDLIKQIQEYKPSLKCEGVFLTQVQWQESVAKTTELLLSRVLPPEQYVPIQIGNTKYLKENSYAQKMLLESDKKAQSSVTKAYIALAKYIIAPNKAQFLKDNEKEISELVHIM